MKKYLLSTILLSGFIGFVTYATVQTMPVSSGQLPKQEDSVSDLKLPANNVKTKKPELNSTLPTAIAEEKVPSVEPLNIDNTPTVKQVIPVPQKIIPPPSYEEREENDD